MSAALPQQDHQQDRRHAVHASLVFRVPRVPSLADLQQEKSHPHGSEPDRSLVNEMVTVIEAPYRGKYSIDTMGCAR